MAGLEIRPAQKGFHSLRSGQAFAANTPLLRNKKLIHVDGLRILHSEDSVTHDITDYVYLLIGRRLRRSGFQNGTRGYPYL